MVRIADSGASDACQMQSIDLEGKRGDRAGRDDEGRAQSAEAVGIALDFMAEYADVFEELAR